MSLINEALKKAQSQQEPSKAVAPGEVRSTVAQAMDHSVPQPSTLPPLAGKRPGVLLPALAGSTILAVLVLGIGLIFWSLNRPTAPVSVAAAAEETKPPPVSASNAAESAAAISEDEGPEPTPTAAEPAPESLPERSDPAAAPVSTPEPAFSIDPAPAAVKPVSAPSEREESASTSDAPAPSPEPVEAFPSPQIAASTAAAPTEPRTSSAAPNGEPAPATGATPTAEPTLVPQSEILDVIEQLEIRGIMADSRRVLIYDRRVKRSFAFGLDSTVSRNPLLKIKDITPSSIIFTDDAGRSFTKSF